MVERLKKIRERIQQHPVLCHVILTAGVLCIVAVQWLALQLSSSYKEYILAMEPGYKLLNLCLVLMVSLVFLVLTTNWRNALLTSSVLLGILAIVCSYVFRYHGVPMALRDLLDAGTALDVTSGYSFAPDLRAMVAIAGMVLNVAGSLFLGWLLPADKTGGAKKRLRYLLLAAAGALGCCIGMRPILEINYIVDWTYAINTYGYLPSILFEGVHLSRTVITPEGYTEQAVTQMAADMPAEDAGSTLSEWPDIILILNESFYDLDIYTETQADRPCLSGWNDRQNCLRGYAVVPNFGGGTNSSEYELLTGNDMFLVEGSAPFNTLTMTDTNNIVTYLKAYGYVSEAMHPMQATNYSRYRAYPAMGFDAVTFLEDFVHRDAYGERRQTDAATYQDLIEHYEASEAQAKFFYTLTYQNHGGYSQTPAEMDRVHTTGDFGEMTGEINEYLTCIALSDQALMDLLDYFDTVDHPVLVCMVGDHAPAFISQLPYRTDADESEQEIRGRATPFMIWGNKAFGTIRTEDVGFVSLTDLVPMLLQTAKMPLSPYYQTILDLQAEIPVRMSSGQYLAADGTQGRFAPEDPRFSMLANYYYLEYNNLQSAEKRVQQMFEAPKISEADP